jgi:hypothetical protein
MSGLIRQLVSYNLRIIFANKFIYFLLASLGFFLLIAVINLFDPDWYPDEATIYDLLLFPGLLLIFYPSAFGIQNDVDSKMIEMLFGIPNYRYKVWLIRLAIIYLMVLSMLFVLCLLSSFFLVPVSVVSMSVQLMFPIFFLGALGFMFSTIIRNGNGTAAVMVILGLIVWISAGIFGQSEWNIFLNPFELPESFSAGLWLEMIFYNRLYLSVGIVLALLAGLYKLQDREKFI